MRRGWRQFAERAGNGAFTDGERSDALAVALTCDWSEEVPDDLIRRVRSVLDQPQGRLFRESTIDTLEQLRNDTSCRPLAGTLVECAMQMVDSGYCGEDALVRVAGNVLRGRAASGMRQIEEHWLRGSSARTAGTVRNRVENAIAGSDMRGIARRCLKNSRTEATRAPLKQTGIDDGVTLEGDPE